MPTHRHTGWDTESEKGLLPFAQQLLFSPCCLAPCSLPLFPPLLLLPSCFPSWPSGKGSTGAQCGASGIISLYIFMDFLKSLLLEMVGKVHTIDFIPCSLGNPVFPIPFPRELKGMDWAQLQWGMLCEFGHPSSTFRVVRRLARNALNSLGPRSWRKPAGNKCMFVYRQLQPKEVVYLPRE